MYYMYVSTQFKCFVTCDRTVIVECQYTESHKCSLGSSSTILPASDLGDKDRNWECSELLEWGIFEAAICAKRNGPRPALPLGFVPTFSLNLVGRNLGAILPPQDRHASGQRHSS